MRSSFLKKEVAIRIFKTLFLEKHGIKKWDCTVCRKFKTELEAEWEVFRGCLHDLELINRKQYEFWRSPLQRRGRNNFFIG